MAIPSWIPGTLAFNALTKEIPGGHEATYTDSASGVPQNIIYRSAQTGEAELSGGRDFVVTLRLLNVGDVILVDRIE